ncbi:MAG TPA: PAS domain S-box protein, partial [Candidatus Limnocylindrales bacterium]
MSGLRARATVIEQVAGATAPRAGVEPGRSAALVAPPLPLASLGWPQLELILGRLHDAVTVQDASGQLVFANAAAARLLDLPDAAAVVAAQGPALLAGFELFDETGDPLPADALPGRRALAGAPAPELVVRFRVRATGEERWSIVSATALPASDGGVALVVNLFRDVTEERRSAGAARLGERLLDEVEASVIATDGDGRVIHWNRAAERLFGFSREEAEGRSIMDLTVPADAIAAAAGIMDEVRQRGRWEGEFEARRRDGGTVPIYEVLTPLHEGAGPAGGLVGVAVDATERRRADEALRASEARARLLADAMPQIVWTAGPDGRVEEFNQRWFDYTGLHSATNRGRGWEGVIHPDDVAETLRRWTASVRTGDPYEIEHRFRRHDGVYRWHLGRGLPLRDETGRVVGWVGTSTDIEDAKRAAEGAAFLDQASRILAGSLDYEETLRRVARLAVPAIADWCTVDLLDQSGTVQLVAVGHVDPAKVRLAEDLRRRFPIDQAARAGVGAVLRTGRAELVESISLDLLAEVVDDPELVDVARDLGLRSSMTVPLAVGDRVDGAITFVAAESGRVFGPNDLALAQELAHRAAVAIENARLYRQVSQLQWALDAALDGVEMLDPLTLRFTYASRGALDQLGCRADQLIGRRIVDVAPELDEAAFRALVDPLMEGQLRSQTATTTLRRSDGTSIPVEMLLQYVPLLPEGGRIVAVVRDISDRLEAEARLQALARAERTRAAEVDAVLRAMGEAVVLLDAGGFVTLANPAAEDLFVGMPLTRFDEILALLEDPDGRAPRLGSARPQGPVELRLHGPQARWVELTAYPVLVADAVDGPGVDGTDAGSVLGAPPERAHPGPMTILVMRDRTAAREEEAMREAFVGVLSHELRTPVTTIYGSSKVLGRLEGRLSDEARREVYRDIEAEAERLYRLVEDLLVLA